MARIGGTKNITPYYKIVKPSFRLPSPEVTTVRGAEAASSDDQLMPASSDAQSVPESSGAQSALASSDDQLVPALSDAQSERASSDIQSVLASSHTQSSVRRRIHSSQYLFVG